MQCSICNEFFDETKINEVLAHEYHAGIVAMDEKGLVIGKSYNEGQSSQVRHIEYSHDISEMRITFKGGAQYRYFNVPLGIFVESARATSIGSYFATNIKRTFDYQKIEPEKILSN